MDLETRYEFLDKIGSGSYATVYRARDNELGREVAVKQIHEQYLEDPEQLERYWQEAQLLASLHHPNIVTIFDIYRERGWLIMELMQANLAQRMAGRQMNLNSLRTTIAHALRALKYLHAQGIVHGDIKPSNLMIDARRRVKIGDFGLARRVSDEEGSMLKGTTKYMAPEAVSDEFGDVGPASDLYSLGFCAYELMCGPNFESLFPGLDAHARNMQAAWMMWHAAPDRRLPRIHRVLEGVPDDLARVIETLCEKKQADRYRTADEALSELKVDLKIVKQGGAADEEEQTEPKPAAGSDKKRLWMAAGALAFSLVLSLLILFSGNGNPGEGGGSARQAGIVRSVDTEAGVLVVEGIEDAVPEEIRLGPKPKIYLLNRKQHILLRELEPGDRVEFEYEEDEQGNRRLELIVARPESSSGALREIQLARQRVVVSIEEGNRREELPLRVTDRTEFLLNGQKTELRSLWDGDRITFSHIAELGRKSGRVLVRMEAIRQQELVGYVSGYDAANRRLTVRYGQGTNTQMTTLPLQDDCEISLQNSGSDGPVKLAASDLRRGDRVRLTYDVAVHEIEVTRPELALSGVVDTVRAGSNQLIVTDSESGEKLTFNVGSGADVTLAHEKVQLGDLRRYDKVVVNYSKLPGDRLSAAAVDATRTRQADRWAIVIGVESYRDPFLSPLRYSIRNANHLKQALLTRYAFQEDRILTLIDADADDMREQIARVLSEASAQTQMLVYVSGHAYVGEDEAVYLAGRDFEFDRMSETGVPLDWLVGRLEACASEEKILLLDTSHLGNQKDLASQPSTATMVRKLKTARKSTSIIASCDDGQRGVDWKEKQIGLFAHFLTEGFGGEADVDRDLRITAVEAFNYLWQNMSTVKIEGGGRQTPVLFRPL